MQRVPSPVVVLPSKAAARIRPTLASLPPTTEDSHIPTEHSPSSITLLDPLDDGPAHAAARELVAAFEAAFPGRVRACYVLGSRADGSGVPTSDLDLAVVFARSFQDDDERTHAAQLAGRASFELDVELSDEAELAAGLPPDLALAGRLIYGEEVRGRFPVVPIEEWARDRMHTSYWRLGTLFGRSGPVSLPLGYPDPGAPCFGYEGRTTRTPDGREAPGTRDLVRHTGWMATAILALDARIYVARKRDCHALYREHIGGEWSELLEEIYVSCTGRWNYLLPETVEEREELRAIGARTLLFERHFLSIYRGFVLAELRSGDERRVRQVVWLLGQIPLRDKEVLAAVEELNCHRGDATLYSG